jgi:hypothetical protein
MPRRASTAWFTASVAWLGLSDGTAWAMASPSRLARTAAVSRPNTEMGGRPPPVWTVSPAPLPPSASAGGPLATAGMAFCPIRERRTAEMSLLERSTTEATACAAAPVPACGTAPRMGRPTRRVTSSG